MGRIVREYRADHPWRFLLAMMCVLLVVVFGTVQVAHNHTDGNETHADCALCLAAHITIHSVAAPAPAPTTSVVTPIEAPTPTLLPRTRFVFALFTRPPPAV